ncbi:ABC transporter ATP-binding protein [Natronobacterium gregoryi]|uniref:ABC transporter n=2 Tax=Natronobacterium gregoryi TaxID=44930 RepID=L0AHB3_NATGS|nr:ABC transporter ATP-binding protein [Natronobacterium gregoryi]AFZ72465.1 ABC-type branched-chain amino acid transport systems, ATPase component [Natronobacterium gregoryi SP2]ELY74335.1 ABC transporter [Natronobacterium gregoryi SP2]PLK21437.1 ABC transporter ATP-binding protein [Natronobacterium gregoryi SP2]SFI77848.1 amino acid/amide ABC transporter ATP-binding protein 2, HAAT family [Natronobacterium gregoryi]
MSADRVLELEEVDAGYGETKVLHDLSLTVDEGEIVSLVGRNGAGKTTTLRSIMGIVNPTDGTVSYRGEEITDLDATTSAKRGLSLVPEERRIFPELTVRENLELAAYGGSTEVDAFSVAEALEMFENLTERTENAGSSLSGGEQQMLAIARALVAGADLILLDEPTEGLAPYIVKDVMHIVRELREQGITVLLVEQNVHVSLELADHNYVINQGEIVWEGSSAELEEDEAILDRYLGVTA